MLRGRRPGFDRARPRRVERLSLRSPDQAGCLRIAMLLAGLSVLSAQEGVALFATDFPAAEFAQRRSTVYDAIGEHGVALVQGAPSPVGYVKFRQSNEFYYLCGVETPHAYLLLDGAARRTSLYLLHHKPGRERSEGKLLTADDVELARDLTGVDAVYGTEMLAEHLARYARAAGAWELYMAHSPAENAATSRDLALRWNADIANDPWDGRNSRGDQFIQRITGRFPGFQVRDLSPILDEMRLIKSEKEIAMIRRATRLSGLALLEAMRSTRPGIFEYELNAVSRFTFLRNRAQGDAYYALIASGRNAWYPHYHASERRMESGDFLLMDHAPDYGYYMSDVTRMWPVNGKFNDWQTELYGFYLACYRAILAAIRPGETASVIKQEAADRMQRIFAGTEFSKPRYRDAAQQFVRRYADSAENPNTRMGHWVGMATHDVGSDTGPLRPGMVFTIEPALRVPEEQIYIRLEDVILITENGKENLSDFVPMEPAEIERVMKEEGLLQRYPMVRMR
jgi:Xaa-Pro aminopeptidase